jgi:hypothetical protein
VSLDPTTVTGSTPWLTITIIRLVINPEPWVEQALCAQTDPELFFPEKGGSALPAKAICRRCPVTEQCLDYALTHRERHGVWGGMSERERRALLHWEAAA